MVIYQVDTYCYMFLDKNEYILSEMRRWNLRDIWQVTQLYFWVNTLLSLNQQPVLFYWIVRHSLFTGSTGIANDFQVGNSQPLIIFAGLGR